MKKILLLFFVFGYFNFSFAQSCLPEGITFSVQSQIDNFPTNYPGCTEILGDVKIDGGIAEHHFYQREA